MRLIDADALIERIKYSFYPDERVSIETVTGCFLDETGCSPTIDAVPIVRCKNCKYWICAINDCYNRGMKSGDFCSYGERREND